MVEAFGGTVWRDAAAWSSLCDPANCPICLAGGPSDVLAELPASWVTAPRVAPLPGYAAIVSKRHAVEPFELRPSERGMFWEDAMTVARALAQLLRPIKVNYEIHGNTVPHLHMHIYPRTPDDPFVGGPIDSRRAGVRRTPEDLERMRRAVNAELRS